MNSHWEDKKSAKISEVNRISDIGLCASTKEKNNTKMKALTKRRGSGGNVVSHSQIEHLAAGISGGVASTILLHPLDLLKIRFAAHDGKLSPHPHYSSMLSAFRTIVHSEGAAGLYRGVVPNLIAASSAWGVYFLVYGQLKEGLHFGGQESSDSIRILQHLAAAAGAGSVSLIVTNPINVVRTRLCLQYGPLSSFTSTSRSMVYRGTFDALQKLYSREGVRGLYKGMTPGMLGVAHGSLQFMAYEELKSRYNRYRVMPEDSKLGTGEYVLFAAMSKIFASFITYPSQVIRTRLQDHHARYAGVGDVIRRTWAREGPKGFYKGFSPYLLHVTPNICLVFLIYEKFTSKS